MFKLRNLADRFSDLDGIAALENRENRYSRLRRLSQRGVITPDTTGRGKIARYSLEEAAIARICLSLYDAGFDTETLRNLDVAFRPPFEGEEWRNLSSVLKCIRDGEPWVFEVDRYRDNLGRLGASGRFRREDQPTFTVEQKAGLAEFNAKQDRKRESTVILYATDLLRPLLSE
jgi:hypothetical protein